MLLLSSIILLSVLLIITCAVSILNTVGYFGLQGHLIFNPQIYLTHHQQKVSFSVDWCLIKVSASSCMVHNHVAIGHWEEGICGNQQVTTS